MADRAVRLLAAAARLVPESWVYPVGRRLGRIAAYAGRAYSARAHANIAAVFPTWTPARRRGVVLRMFEHLGIGVLEAVRLPTTPLAVRSERVSVQGREIFDAAFRRGRGVVAATGHIGNWEVLAACFADLGYPVHVVARRHPNPRLHDFIVGLRNGYGVNVLDRDRDTRGMLKALRGGEIVALLVDQDTRVQGTMLPFLGVPAVTPLGHVRLALRTGAALVALTITREDSGRHAVTVWEEIIPDTSLPEEDRTEVMARRCNEILGKAISLAPEQWVWMHRRWRQPSRVTT
ncbi:lysophospholipid acyltransferase family protein [Candidatus Fermentibacteria bacterium]|nr:lysophospholipid acyltransferase family protein [Candidatus Fermentibacteria bacterium]